MTSAHNDDEKEKENVITNNVEISAEEAEGDIIDGSSVEEREEEKIEEDDLIEETTATVVGKLKTPEDEREVISSRPDKSLSMEVTFDQNISSPRELVSELQRQADSVTRRLRSQGLLARTIQIKVRDYRFRTVTRSRSLVAPTSSSQLVFKQARALLQTWLEEHVNTPVRLLGVGLSGLEEQGGQGKDIDSATQKALDKTLDEINRRYGEDKAMHALGLKTGNKKNGGT